jgi:hypothetical protein
MVARLGLLIVALFYGCAQQSNHAAAEPPPRLSEHRDRAEVAERVLDIQRAVGFEKITVELVVEPAGEVSACRISKIGDRARSDVPLPDDLEQSLCNALQRSEFPPTPTRTVVERSYGPPSAQ